MYVVPASDHGVQPTPAVTDRTICRALGEELRREREERGWSRGYLVSLLPSGIGERTLLSYEHGARQMAVPRVVEVCAGLGIAPSALIAAAMQRARLSLANLTLRIDLRDLMNRPSEEERFQLITRWARNRLEVMADDDHGVVVLPPKAIAEMAHMIGVAHVELANYLAEYIDES